MEPERAAEPWAAAHDACRRAQEMEPAAYLEGKGGYRLNDDVLVWDAGAEVLSAAVPRDLEWLIAG